MGAIQMLDVLATCCSAEKLDFFAALACGCAVTCALALFVGFCFFYLSSRNRLCAPGRIFEHLETPLGRIHCRRFAAADRHRDELCIAVGGIGGGVCYWEEFLQGLSKTAGMDILAID